MRFNFAPQDILRIARQRLFWFAIPFALLSIMGLMAISSLPPLYESRALLLVQGQQVPDEFVMPTVQTEAEERMNIVRAEVMSRNNILRTAERFDLFEGRRLSPTEKQEYMDDRTRIVIRRTDRRNRRDDGGLLTTEIAFLHEDPKVAQRVAVDLSDQFQREIVEQRQEQASEATGFLREAERKTRRQMAELAAQIAEIKEANPDALPDNMSVYQTSYQRLSLERDRVAAQIDQTRADIEQLRIQGPTFTAATPDADEAQLRDLRRQLTAARREYTETYPLVIALKQQVLDLEREVDPDAFRRNAREEINVLSRELTEARKGTTEYETMAERRDELRAQLRNLPAGATTITPGEATFQGRMYAYESRLESLERQLAEKDEAIVKIEAQMEAVPDVERQLYELIAERDRLERELTDLQRDRAQAELGESLETQAKAERIRPVENPVVADEPSSPDKPKLALAVFFLAAALAGALVLIPEILFAKVQSKDHLKSILPDAAVVEVPRFKTADERLPKLITTASLTAATLVLGIALSWTTIQTLV